MKRALSALPLWRSAIYEAATPAEVVAIVERFLATQAEGGDNALPAALRQACVDDQSLAALAVEVRRLTLTSKDADDALLLTDGVLSNACARLSVLKDTGRRRDMH